MRRSDGSEEPVRVLIADDHAIVREGLCTILRNYQDICVVGEAIDGSEAAAKAAELLPDVVLMDIRMGGFDDGVEATRLLKGTTPNANVIILTNYDEEENVFDSMRAGASGYLMKEVSPQELVNAIRTVAQGYSLIYPSVARRVLREFEGKPASNKLPPQSLDDLTPREREVLALVAQGHPNKQIANQLCITERTVKTHMSNILSKLQMSDRTQVALYAVKQGVAKELPSRQTPQSRY
ncbi:MAG: response regulator transcription factor [Chloroflexi bacterium]|nr:response regulator transcription factor [Chloroflexota bacterium]